MISIITPIRAKDAQSALWLHEAIASVHDQTFTDWEMVVVNDHSVADLSAVKAAWPKVVWLEAEGQGVSAARNQAAEAATGELLLPLDGDDKLAPSALAQFKAAWDKRGEAGIIYSDVVMFGQDYAQVYLSPEYDFRTLLMSTFMVVGCLHRKEDWQKAGGWRLDMSMGLEDWEYWIALGEMGVCGKRLPEPLYWYRRHPTGRLAWLKANRDLWDKAYLSMRELHRSTFDGRFPMGCCGGKARAAAAAAVPRASAAARAASMMTAPAPTVAIKQAPVPAVVKMVYVGPRKGGFIATSAITRTRYNVAGQGQLVQMGSVQGVRREDVAWFRSVSAGRDFKVVEEPRPVAAPPPPLPVSKPVAPASPDSEAWVPAVMEAVEEIPIEENDADSKPAKASRTRRK